MNIIKKLKLDIESLVELANSEQKFFSPIASYIKKLNTAIQNKEIDVEELDFLIKKIEEFYKRHRPSNTPGVLYISPRQISNSNSNIREIQGLITELQNLNSKELKKEFEESRNDESSYNEVNNPLNLSDSNMNKSSITIAPTFTNLMSQNTEVNVKIFNNFRELYNEIERRNPENRKEIMREVKTIENELNKESQNKTIIQKSMDFLKSNASWIVPSITQIIVSSFGG